MAIATKFTFKEVWRDTGDVDADMIKGDRRRVKIRYGRLKIEYATTEISHVHFGTRLSPYGGSNFCIHNFIQLIQEPATNITDIQALS